MSATANLVTRAWPAIWRQSLATMIQYRGEIALWALWGFVYPAVSLAMWTAAIAGGDSGDSLGGYSARQFAAYFLITMVVGHFTAAWDLYEMGYAVRSGAFSPLLLRPLLPMWGSLADNLAYKVVTLMAVAPIWLLFGWWTGAQFDVGPLGVLLGLVALVIGAAVNFLWGYNLALLAFFTTRTDAVGEFWFGGSLLFGGRLAPLALMPWLMQFFAALMPFKWVTWFPTELLIGRIAPADAWSGFAWQLGWLIAAVIAFRLTWPAAIRRYSAVGA